MLDQRSTAIAAIFAVLLATGSVQAADGSGGVNAPEQRNKPYLVLLSIDGFGWDARGRASTPALDRLVATGVTARTMRPVWPSLTFPNHYSIATGLVPSEHGIVGNNFPSDDRSGWYTLSDREVVQDGAWYGGEPIWVRAERSGMVSASYFFVGTEAPVGGVRPTYSYLFDAEVPAEKRVGKVLDWLGMPEDQRPHMITLYFEFVDDASHRFGPDAPLTAKVIERVDAYVGDLLDGIDALDIRDEVYVIVVSDHGQTRYRAPEDAYVLDDHVDIRDAGVVEGGNYVMLYYDDPDVAHIRAMVETINATWKHGKAYARADTPAAWHIAADDERYADVLLQAYAGQAVVTSRERLSWLSTGAHGWPPESEGMGATFIASGPRLPKGVTVDEISVLDVYPLMLSILDLEPPPGYAPDASALDGILLDADAAD